MKFVAACSRSWDNLVAWQLDKVHLWNWAISMRDNATCGLLGFPVVVWGIVTCLPHSEKVTVFLAQRFKGLVFFSRSVVELGCFYVGEYWV